MAGEYADEKYLNLAIPSVVKGADGKDKTVYLDIDTGEEIKDLSGYTVYNGTEYYDPDKATTDTNKDGKLDPEEVTASGGSSSIPTKTNDHGMTDPSGGPKGTASNNFGYAHKPGYLGAVGTVAGMVNPFAGATVGLVGKAMNVNNMDAVNSARKGLGLSPLTGGQQLKGAMKDNKGQVANVNIGDKKYSVGFEALSPDGKTNLTYNEARTRAALAKQQITETPKNEVTAAPAKDKKSLMSKVTGLEKGWATKALDHVFGFQKDPNLPDEAPTPTARPSTTPTRAPSPEASVGLPNGPVGISTPGDPNAHPVQAGQGLANLAGAAGKAATSTGVGPNGIHYDHPDRGSWNAGMTKDTQDTAARLSGAIGGMNMSSGYRSPATNAAVGGAKNSMHQAGKAFDVDTRGMTDDQKQKAVEMGRLAGATGIGTYTDQSLHFDLGARPPADAIDANGNPVHPGAIKTVDNTYGMMNRTANNAATNAPGWFTKGMTEDRFAPTPTARPDNTTTSAISPAKSYDSQVGLNATRAVAAPNAFASMKNSMKPSTPSYSPVSDVKAPNTPAGLAAMGFTNRTPAEKAQIARTIAGELGQKSLAALRGTDPVAAAAAKAEVGSIVASMENRAATTKYAGSVVATQTPSQYNSLMSSNAAVTNQNFANNPAVAGAVNSFYSGAQPGVNYGATNYHATAMSHPPGWSGAMTDTSVTGQHTFGHLGGFTPNSETQAAMGAFGTMAGTNFSPGKARDDAVGYSGSTHPSTYGGAGFTPGGMNSPSSSVGSSGLSTGLGRTGYSGSTGAGFSPGGMNSPSGSSSTGSSRTGGSTGGFAGGHASGSTSAGGSSLGGSSSGRSGSAGGSSAAGGSRTSGGATGGAGGNNGKSNGGGHYAD